MALNCQPALSLNPGWINEELFSALAQAGIVAVELSPGRVDETVFDYDEVRHLAEKYGVRLWSYHLPFFPFEDADIANPAIAERTVELYKQCIQKANAIGIKIFVAHPSKDPVEDEVRAAWMACAKNSLQQLAAYAAPLGCTVAVENLPRKCLGNTSDEMLELVSAHEGLRVCFDTNHLLQEDVAVFIRMVGEKFITTHISDYDFINERHWLPGEGKIDWPALVAALAETGYDGYWLYEVDLAAPWSIDRPRDLTACDYCRNYEEIMAGAPLSRIGTPKKNLGMWKVMEQGATG